MTHQVGKGEHGGEVEAGDAREVQHKMLDICVAVVRVLGVPQIPKHLAAFFVDFSRIFVLFTKPAGMPSLRVCLMSFPFLCFTGPTYPCLRLPCYNLMPVDAKVGSYPAPM
jgi:hypothetical protein